MKNAPMRFCGISLHHNPAKLTVRNTANIRSLSAPHTSPDAEHLGLGLWIVKGEGELYGADCMEQYQRLSELYQQEKRGLLSLPGLPVMTAYLSELALGADATENVITYHFSFVQAQGGGCAVSPAQWYTAAEGDSMWDIAVLHEMSIDALVRMNPGICRLDNLSAGERVRVC